MPAAFIVDAQTEKKIVQTICPGVTVRTTNLNGYDVSIDAIAKAVSSLIRLFKGRYFPVFIIIDREGRTQSSEELERHLESELAENHGIDGSQIIVTFPDRMIENWMIGDVIFFDQVYDIQIAGQYEGQNGKSIIRRLLAEKKITYHETTVGVGIFSHIDPNNICHCSASFKRFRDRAKPYCSWLRPVV
jgi:hypothetical protein